MFQMFLLGVGLSSKGTTLPGVPQVPDGKDYAEPHVQVTTAETVSLQTGSAGHRKDEKRWVATPSCPLSFLGPRVSDE